MQLTEINETAEALARIEVKPLSSVPLSNDTVLVLRLNDADYPFAEEDIADIIEQVHLCTQEAYNRTFPIIVLPGSSTLHPRTVDELSELINK